MDKEKKNGNIQAHGIIAKIVKIDYFKNITIFPGHKFYPDYNISFILYAYENKKLTKLICNL